MEAARAPTFSNYAGEAGHAILEGWNLTLRPGGISAPTLILVGKDDFVCPPSQANIMHEGIPNSKLVVFEKSGHFTHVEEPEAFFDAIRGWLRRSRGELCCRGPGRLIWRRSALRRSKKLGHEKGPRLQDPGPWQRHYQRVKY
jgi:hypothetical protein